MLLITPIYNIHVHQIKKKMKILIQILQNRFSTSILCNRIGGEMVIMLISSAVYCGFEPHSDQIKDYKIGICCFSTKNAALRRKNKDWLARNQTNMSMWKDMSTRRLLFQ